MRGGRLALITCGLGAALACGPLGWLNPTGAATGTVAPSVQTPEGSSQDQPIPTPTLARGTRRPLTWQGRNEILRARPNAGFKGTRGHGPAAWPLFLSLTHSN